MLFAWIPSYLKSGYYGNSKFLLREWGFRMDVELQKIGSRVKQARLAKHMTQQQLAEAAGISISFLSNIENGRQSMNLRALITISEALGVSADRLIRDLPPTASRITEEIESELSSCTPKEREAILQLVQLMKQSLIGLKNSCGE